MPNFKYPTGYDDDFLNTFKKVLEYLNSMGFTYEQSLRLAENILEEAKKTNDMNESVQQQIDTLIAESGTSDAEVLQARVDSKGIEYSVLKERLDKDEDELQNQKDFKDYEIQNKTRKTEALFTIIDDDAGVDVLTTLVPLQKEFNIPMVSAVIPGATSANFLKKDDIVQMYNDGWEISSHTYSHVRLDTLTVEQQEEEFRNSVETLKSWGIEGVNTVCYPFGRRNDDTVIAGRKFFRSGRTTDYGINRPPFQTWDIVAINGDQKTHTLDSLKADIDDISENGGWGVFITHASLEGNKEIGWAREIIEYVISKGVEIVGYNEALNRMGNIVDTGRYLKNDKTKEHFVVGADGSTSSHTNPDMFVQKPYRATQGSTGPLDFKQGVIEYSTVSGVDGFPATGVLTTSTLLEGYATQTLISTDNRTYSRQQKSNTNEWGSWVENNIAVTTYASSQITAESVPEDFQDKKITYTPISDVSGFPAGGGTRGLLTTNRLGNMTFQEFMSNDSAGTRYSLYHRRWLGSSWEAWEALPYDFSASSTYYRNNFSFTDRKPGEKYFNTTLNKPMFINAESNGFVDAMGNTITL